jgi:hypothetical protein
MTTLRTPKALILAAAAAALAVPANADWQLRDIDKVEHSRSIYFVSFPFNRGFLDLSGGPGAERQPDGIVDSADVLVDWFTGGDGLCPGEPGNSPGFPDECGGILTLFTFEADSGVNTDQTFRGQTIRRGWSRRVMLLGESFSIEDPSDPKSVDEPPQGYIAVPARGRFPTVTTGSHDPAWGGGVWELPEYWHSRNLHIFSLPWETVYGKSCNLLLDIFDEPEHQEVITLLTFDPDPASNPEQIITAQTIFPCVDIGGTPGCIPDNGFDCGDGFCLRPGHGYMIQIRSAGSDGIVRVPLTTDGGER